MKIKTYEAPTEQEAIEMVKKDLGGSAIILTIKKISPKGIFRLFRKQKFEVTAAADEAVKKNEDAEKTSANQEASDKAPPSFSSSENMLKDVKISEQQVKIQTLEEILANKEELLKNIVAHIAVEPRKLTESNGAKFDNHMLQLFYETLVKNGVTNEISIEILSDLDTYFDDADTNINFLVKLVYNRIIQRLGQPKPLVIDRKPKMVVFMGPTGVGKTTTIAKLASRLIIGDNKKVGLVTADTYRIAAVEQLKTYGDILDIGVEVVYGPEDLKNSIRKIGKFNDVIFIDTAGRSHKNQENLIELKELLAVVPEAELYLVLSSTTKYEDLRLVAKAYEDIGDYTIIFTKIDETGDLGLALNLCCETGKPLSYLTDGQNVPEDIIVAEPAIIAKALLGSFEY